MLYLFATYMLFVPFGTYILLLFFFLLFLFLVFCSPFGFYLEKKLSTGSIMIIKDELMSLFLELAFHCVKVHFVFLFKVILFLWL